MKQGVFETDITNPMTEVIFTAQYISDICHSVTKLLAEPGDCGN